MTQQEANQVQIGDYVMRSRSEDKEPEWTLTLVNSTYLDLIREFPEDYKLKMDEKAVKEWKAEDLLKRTELLVEERQLFIESTIAKANGKGVTYDSVGQTWDLMKMAQIQQDLDFIKNMISQSSPDSHAWWKSISKFF